MPFNYIVITTTMTKNAIACWIELSLYSMTVHINCVYIVVKCNVVSNTVLIQLAYMQAQ